MEIVGVIDHTILRPDATEDDIIKLCEEAKRYRFITCCVHPFWVSIASKFLMGTGIKTCSVTGFPFGASSRLTKCFEAEGCVKDGAEEIDMVMNIGAFKSGEAKVVEDEIKEVVKRCGVIVKVIIETGLLSKDEMRDAAKIVLSSGAHFVKTSTGFSTSGARVEDVQLLKSIVGDSIGIKASGGIRTYQQAVEMLSAGATRLGTSSGVEIAKNTPGGT